MRARRCGRVGVGVWVRVSDRERRHGRDVVDGRIGDFDEVGVLVHVDADAPVRSRDCVRVQQVNQQPHPQDSGRRYESRVADRLASPDDLVFVDRLAARQVDGGLADCHPPAALVRDHELGGVVHPDRHDDGVERDHDPVRDPSLVHHRRLGPDSSWNLPHVVRLPKPASMDLGKYRRLDYLDIHHVPRTTRPAHALEGGLNHRAGN